MEDTSLTNVTRVLAAWTAAILLIACGTPVSPVTPGPAETAAETPAPTVEPTMAAPTQEAASPAPQSTAAVEPTDTLSPTAVAPEEPTKLPSEELGEDVAIVVNGQTIAREAYLLQIEQARSYFLQQPGLDAASEAGQQALQRLDLQVLQWLIDQALIEQGAYARGVQVSEADIETAIQTMRGDDASRFEAWLAANALAEDDLRSQVRYDLLTAAMRDLVTSQLQREVLQINVRHILTSEESAATRAVQALRAGANFIELARQVSEDATTRSSGGGLGFLPRGVMPPTFDEVAFAMQPGEISDVIRSEFGFHVIQVVEIDPSRRVPDELWPVVQERAFVTWLEEQRAQADIQIAAWVTEAQEG